MEQNKNTRRQLLRGLALSGMAGAAGVFSGAVQAHGVSSAPVKNKVPVLARGKWSLRNWNMLNDLIVSHGNKSRGYKAKRKPYAVFDWDNTCIMNDCEEALLMYQINTLSFKLTPQEFATITRQHVPPGPFTGNFKNAAGNPLDLESICSDLDQDYQYLHAEYVGMAGKKSLAEVSQSPQFQDFRAKLYFLYEAVNDTHGVAVGYPWVVYFFANMSLAELSALADRSHDAALGAGLVKQKYSSPESLPGKAGVISVSHFHGIRLCTEIAELMDVMRTHGFDIYVSTASLEDVVAVFATYAKYGYHVERENVLGLRLERDGEIFKNAYLKNWPLNWGPGKTELIKRELVAKKGYGPIFVAGDSDGDYDMLRDFADTKLSLVVNRLKKGKIGELCKIAAGTLGEAKPRYLLQGRQESTGNLLPSEMTLKLGKTTPEMLP